MIKLLLPAALGVSFATQVLAGVSPLSDTFNANSNTFSNWTSVGALPTLIQYDTVSSTDYDLNDLINSQANPLDGDGVVGNLSGDAEATGDGLLNDGGLKFNSQDATAGNEAIGLTLNGTMSLWEQYTLTVNLYNENSSYWSGRMQLYDLTVSNVLAETANQSVLASGTADYVPASWTVSYIAKPADVGHVLQIRVVEDANSATRDAYLDSFALNVEVVAPPEPPGDLYPRGDIFAFTFYSTKVPDALYSLTNGATAIGPYYGVGGSLVGQATPLSNAIAWNTKLTYKVEPPSMAGLTHADRDDPGFVWPSDRTISNEVAAIVNAVKTNASISIWDVEPEELRFYKPQETNYLRVVYSAIHANDPSNRPVNLYQQNNRTAAQLGLLMPNLDLCLKGTYVNAITDDAGGACFTNRIWARWSMKQAVDACALYNTNARPWIGLWMAEDPPPGYTTQDVTNWCRHDAYMGLIMGGKGIQIWSGSRGRTNFSDTYFDAYLGGYLSVAKDLNGALDLAPVFLFGEPRTNVSMAITSGPATQHLEYSGQVYNYPSIAYRSLLHNGATYLLMVNSAERSVTATFSGVPNKSRTDLFAGTNAPTPGGAFSITLPRLAVRAFRFEPNHPPSFSTNLLWLPGGVVGAAWSSSLAGYASDSDLPEDALTFSKLSGPSWLSVSTNGALSGVPGYADFGTNAFAIQVTDASGASAAMTIMMTVAAPGCDPMLVMSENFAGETLATLTNQGWTFSGQTNTAEMVASTANSPFLGTKSYLRVGSSNLSQPFGQKAFGPITNGQLKAVTFATSSYSSARIKLLDADGVPLFAFYMSDKNSLATEHITPGFSSDPMPNGATHNLLSPAAPPLGFTELTVTWGRSNLTWQAVNRNATNGAVNYDTGRQSAVFTTSGVPNQIRFDTGAYNHTARYFGATDIQVTDTTGACAPGFTNNPIFRPNATNGFPYAASIAAAATDGNNDSLAFSKVSGPAWLALAPNGALSGTPGVSDLGTNSFLVRVADPGGLFATATLNINVVSGEPVTPPRLNLQITGGNLLLSWPAAYTSFSLHCQTNPLDLGLSTNWAPAPGAVSNQLLIPLAATNSAVFFRLKKVL